MPLDFPSSPSTNQTYSFGGATWKYDGSKWNLVTNLVPSYETTLPSPAVDGQEIYYKASGAMTTQGIVWHLRYRSAARNNAGAWEFVGGSPLHAGPSGSANTTSSTTAGTALTNGPTLTIPATGTYRISYGAELQSTANPWAVDIGLLLYDGNAVASYIYITLVAQYDRDWADKTVELSPSSGTVYTLRFRNNQARSLDCADGTLTITPAFLNP